MKNIAKKFINAHAWLAIAVMAMFQLPIDCLAQWSDNSYLNTIICIDAETQGYSDIVSDGAGGAIISWYDTRDDTSGNGDPVWPASGTRTFSNSAATAITRDGGVEITIDSITEANLTLTLQWDQTTLGGGRISSVSGNHVFELHR